MRVDAAEFYFFIRRTPGMLLDASDIGEDVDDVDVCIVGGGPAGLTLASALTSRRRKIVVLEGGGWRKTTAGQALLEGNIIGSEVHAEPHRFRVRALGGASQIWGGRCLPYDPVDFSERPWVAETGWPIAYEELLPYYVRAQEAAEAGAFDYRPRGPLVQGLDGELVTTSIERFSRPTDFGRRYGPGFRAAVNTHLILQANVTAIRLEPSGRSVSHVEVARRDGSRFRIKAASYVLAGGGLETVRLLLASNHVNPNGIGNDRGWLGCGYMCHIATTIGTIALNGPSHTVAFDYEQDADGVYLRRRLSLTAQAQRARQILNLTFRLHLPDPADPAHSDPILSAMYLTKRLLRYEYSYKMRERRITAGAHLRHVGNMVRRPLHLSRFAYNWIQRRHLDARKLPSLVLHSPANRYALEFHAEQAPNRSSRLTLSPQTDALGLRRLQIEWRISDIDVETVKQSYRLLAAELIRTGTGRLVFDEDSIEDEIRHAGAFGGHHIGAARMSADPANGVVDPDCRVHGVANLFVASAAVMPTSGQANPTLTVLALAFRLADHLTRSMD
jgi:choline dehydrogenase-like flavoprotein